MKKIFLTAAFLNFAALCYSQVGIGENPTDLHPSEALKISSSNKGIIIPNVEITDLNSSSPITPPLQPITNGANDPNEGLLVYNTKILGNGILPGFYIWKNNKWNALLNSSNYISELGTIESTTVKSTNSVQTSTARGAITYIENSSPSSQWNLIPGLDTTFRIKESPLNDTTVSVSGIVQASRSGSGSGQSTQSYAIGIYVNDKLVSVRNFLMETPPSCSYSEYNIMATLKDLPKGQHKVQVYMYYRANTANNNTVTLAVGGKNSNCNNSDIKLSNDMAKSTINILVTER